MNKTFFRGLLAALVSLVLTACGGGDSTTTVAAKPADALLTQVPSSLPVTPGETFRATLLNVTCPLSSGSTDFCAKQAPLGDLGFEVGLELLNSKVLYNGRQINGYFNREGSLYRFVLLERFELWQTGSIELIATLSPNAATGEKSLVVVHAASASFDRTIEFKSGTAKIEVLALPHYAPAVVASDNPGFVTGNTDMAEVSHFSYTCPVTVLSGCTLREFDVNLNGVVEGAEVRVYVAGDWYLQGFGDATGFSTYHLGVWKWVPAGETITVQVFGTMKPGGSIWFGEVISLSGDKEIAPKLSKECTAASPRNCKN